jgi:enediyne biosynthesis protein E5
MTPSHANTTLMFYPHGEARARLIALWYFNSLLIVWTILGHTILGFEQSWAAPVVGVGAAIFLQFLLEWVDAKSRNRPSRLTGGVGALADMLPPPIISGLACSMLLYPNEHLWPIIFAVAVSIGSKVLLRAPVGGGRTQHVFNPSNLGVALTLVLFPWVGFAPPYHFTNNLTGGWLLAVPALVLLSGILVHSFFTWRMPLCMAWIAGFVLQAFIRHWLVGSSVIGALVPMTSAAFIVFTLYMIPDPATTPLDPLRQALFGFSVALVYGGLLVLHVVFGLFFALLTVSIFRGVGLYVLAWSESRSHIPVALLRPAAEASSTRGN